MSEAKNGVFALTCPMNDSCGRDDWYDAIEEYIAGDLDIKLSSERNMEGFPGLSLAAWSDKLKGGELWKKWLGIIFENGVDLKNSGEDLLPMAELFAEIAGETLDNAKNSLSEKS